MIKKDIKITQADIIKVAKELSVLTIYNDTHNKQITLAKPNIQCKRLYAEHMELLKTLRKEGVLKSQKDAMAFTLVRLRLEGERYLGAFTNGKAYEAYQPNGGLNNLVFNRIKQYSKIYKIKTSQVANICVRLADYLQKYFSLNLRYPSTLPYPTNFKYSSGLEKKPDCTKKPKNIIAFVNYADYFPAELNSFEDSAKMAIKENNDKIDLASTYKEGYEQSIAIMQSEINSYSDTIKLLESKIKKYEENIKEISYKMESNDIKIQELEEQNHILSLDVRAFAREFDK